MIDRPIYLLMFSLKNKDLLPTLLSVCLEAAMSTGTPAHTLDKWDRNGISIKQEWKIQSEMKNNKKKMSMRRKITRKNRVVKFPKTELLLCAEIRFNCIGGYYLLSNLPCQNEVPKEYNG